jgi:hypothetical protein
MLNEDGEPVKTNRQLGAEYGDRMPAALGEGVSFEYFILAETFKATSRRFATNRQYLALTCRFWPK